MLYKNFVHLYPSSPQVPIAREQMDKLQELLAAEQKAKVAPPTTTVEPKSDTQPQTTPSQPAQPQAQAQTQTTPAASPTTEPTNENPPIWKKWWFWTAVGVVVVAAVVIPVAVVESQGSWNNLPPQGPGAATARPVLHGPHVEVRW